MPCRIALKVLTVKSTVLHKRAWGCSSPSSRPWARRWRTINVCDAWPVQHQTYGYLPSCNASLPIGWYQIILLGDRGTRLLTTCLGLHSTVGRLGFEPTTYWLQVRHPTRYATEPHRVALVDIKFSTEFRYYFSSFLKITKTDHLDHQSQLAFDTIQTALSHS